MTELSSGKVGRRHGGGGTGLAIYGRAVGELRSAAILAGYEVHGVLENDWTQGRSKAARQMMQAEQVTVLITDHGLPDGRGVNLLKAQATASRVTQFSSVQP